MQKEFKIIEQSRLIAPSSAANLYSLRLRADNEKTVSGLNTGWHKSSYLQKFDNFVPHHEIPPRTTPTHMILRIVQLFLMICPHAQC